MSEEVRAQNDPSGEGLPASDEAAGDQFQGGRHSAEPTEEVNEPGGEDSDEELPGS